MLRRQNNVNWELCGYGDAGVVSLGSATLGMESEAGPRAASILGEIS